MALLLALVISVITLVSMYFFMDPAWHMPPYISEYGAAYDSHFKLTLTAMGIVFFLAQLGLAYVVFRYRDQGKRAAYSHGNNTMEVAWTLATLVLFVGLVLIGQHIWQLWIIHMTPDLRQSDSAHLEAARRRSRCARFPLWFMAIPVGIWRESPLAAGGLRGETRKPLET